nr:hypothetical protein [Flavobacterium tegetincola]
MFSQGQLIFAALFVVVFIAVITFSYLKDKKIHAVFYKKSYIILLFFFLFIAILFAIKTFLKD